MHVYNRFQRFIVVDLDSYCFNWMGSRNHKGYGMFRNDKWVPAHRFAYEYKFGKIPVGLIIDHLCRNRSCVNPDHMELVTNKENIMRGTGICAINAKKTKCMRNHDLSGDNLYVRKNGARRCRRCDSLRRSGLLYQRD